MLFFRDPLTKKQNSPQLSIPLGIFIRRKSYFLVLIQFEYGKHTLMASKSKIAKQKQNAALVKKYAAKRAELLKNLDYEGLRKLPRRSSATCYRRLCEITGRPRGNYRKFKVSRIILRDLALDGLVPGMKKASW